MRTLTHDAAIRLLCSRIILSDKDVRDMTDLLIKGRIDAELIKKTHKKNGNKY